MGNLISPGNSYMNSGVTVLTLSRPGSGKTLKTGGGPLWPSPGFSALGLPKAPNVTLAHF